MILLKAGAAAAASTAIFLVAPAAAQNQEPFVVEGRLDPDVQTRYVSYRDLNLRDPLAVERLHRRVEFAARGLCFDNGVRPLKQELDSRRCFQQSMALARPQIDAAIGNFDMASAEHRVIRVAAR